MAERVTQKTDLRLWSNDWLIFVKAGDTQSLGIARNYKTGKAALKYFNRDREVKGTIAVRITTFRGTLHQLISKSDPSTLRWARDGKTNGAKMAREIAKELGVKLPPKNKAEAVK